MENLQKIVVEFDNECEEIKPFTFIGRWLAKYVRVDSDCNSKYTGAECAVAITSKNKLIFFSGVLGAKQFYDYAFYDSFEIMKNSGAVPTGLISLVAIKLDLYM